MSVENLKAHLRAVPDFPLPGITFWDITTLIKDPECLREVIDAVYERYKDKGITKVVGLESRGFFIGAAVAARLGAGFVPARKAGKLPYDVLMEPFEKEYGRDIVEMHTDAIGPDDVVLMHDDLLATGGTMAAALRLVDKFSPARVYANFIIEIDRLGGRSLFPEGLEVESIIHV